MRQLLVQVPRGRGQEALDIADSHQGTNLARFEGTGRDGPLDLLIVHVSNRRVSPLIEALQALPEMRVTLLPQGVMPLHPPSTDAADQVKDVEDRSPLEFFLGGLQSIGSWRGFLGYAAVAGVVVWIGLYTNTIFLLIAAMLIAPFAGPAMNVAMASARGDYVLLRQGLIRYVAALGTGIAVAALLSLMTGQRVATSLMIDQSQVSMVAVLIPLAAGTAGALNLVQSERSSLVSGAAAGMLIAASLAPPAGMVGMASAIGEWEMVANGTFVLLLQLVGINLAGALVFRAYGLTAQGARYTRGRDWLFPVTLAVTLAAMGVFLFIQFSTSPRLQRPSQAQKALAEIEEVVNQSQMVELVEADVRFTGADIGQQNTLLGVIYVRRNPGQPASDEEIRTELTRLIQERLLTRGYNVIPFMDVSILDAPPAPADQPAGGERQ